MLACMFPGQGSQHADMGREWFPSHPALCATARKTLGYSIESVCLGDGPEKLNSTEYTQPAIYFVSCLAFLERRKQGDFDPDLYLGHSLGLYACLFAAGVFDLATGLRLVAERGRLMATMTGGAMMAVLGDAMSQVPAILLDHGLQDVDIANYNGPRQAVISGRAESIMAAGQVLERVGYTCARLPVSGAFHSRQMEPARLRFVQVLQRETFRPPTAAVVSTTDGRCLTGTHLIEELGFQLTKPVRWMQTVKMLQGRHAGLRFQEVGPGQVLTRLQAQQTLT